LPDLAIPVGTFATIGLVMILGAIFTDRLEREAARPGSGVRRIR
jgi:hypothetical protein